MPGEITALKVQPGKPNRVEVYLDGICALRIAKILALSLRIGQTLSQSDVEALILDDQCERTYQHALDLIRRRPRSEKELRQRYQRKQVPGTVVDKVLARLRSEGTLDDQAFAHAWVENRLAFRPRGIRALRYELRQKGISDAEIEAAIQDVDEEQAAMDAARKATRRYRHLSEDLFHKRLGAYLARRGFRYSLISTIVERMWLDVVNELGESEG